MRRLLPLAALIATPAYADGFKNREIAWQVLNAADAAQTCHIVSRGGSEANPLARAIIGREPSSGALRPAARLSVSSWRAVSCTTSLPTICATVILKPPRYFKS